MFVGHHSDAMFLPHRRRQRLLATLCAAALLAPTLPVAAQGNTLPALGDPISEDFGIGVERRLGDQIMRDIRRDPDYLDDPLLLEYLNTLWSPLVQRSRSLGNIDADIDQRFAWEAFLVRDRSVNAFALPGGFVGVHLGLIALTSTHDELGAVLAHELSHVTQRHIARGITNSKRQTLLGTAAMILGVLAASRAGNADVANAAIAGGQAAAIQGQLNFSRDMEREADRVGYAVLSGAGFAQGGMASMFEKLEQSSRLNDSGGFPYLRSHPLTTERIGEARQRAGVDAGTARASAGGLEHSLAQARARVLMDNRSDSLRRWQASDVATGSGPLSERLVAAAQSALASTMLRDWARADASLQRATALLRSSPVPDPRAERALAFLATQSLLERGQAAQATALFKPYAGDGSRPAVLLGARLALATAPPESAANDAALKFSAEELQTRVAAQPQDALSWYTLSQVWARVGQPLRALRADAESRYAQGDLPGALDRLRAGQRLARGGAQVDFIEASVIDARLRDIEAQRKLQVEEERKGS